MERTDPHYGPYREVLPTEPWNYGLIANELRDSTAGIRVEETAWDGSYPWTLENAPLRLHLTGLRVPEWTAEDGVPHLPAFWGSYGNYEETNVTGIELVPYGCTELRISEFPAYRLRNYERR